MKRDFKYLSIEIKGNLLELSMSEEQFKNAIADGIFEKSYYDQMFWLFEEPMVNGQFYWWCSATQPEAPYISTEQEYDEENDRFVAAGDIYYFPKYMTNNEVRELESGMEVYYHKI